jgi:monofunctional biosynthetic peptidoglycan transglycosylase
MALFGKRPRLRWYHYPFVLVGGFYALVLLSLVYLRFLPPVTTGVQVQRRVEAMLSGAEYEKRYDFLPMSEISENLQHAVVAAEDTRFFQHRGFDLVEIRKAQETARRRGTAPRGASTITQQLVKNLFFTTHRSVIRKGLEMTITPFAEVVLGKERILELYLNVIEWGPGVYGAAAATEYHYGVPAGELSKDRAARLAAVIPAPLTRSPARMDSYSQTILTRMRQMGW